MSVSEKEQSRVTNSGEFLSLDEMVSFYLDTVDFILSLFESEYPYVRERAHGRARYAKLIANELALSCQTITVINLSAYFREIQNIVSLKKEDDFTFDDKELKVKDISNLLFVPSGIKKIIETIDEHYDGSGPKKIREHEIPVGARIIKAVDIFEDKIKKDEEDRTIQKERAFRVLRKESGTLLDPTIVELFIKVIKDEFFIPKLKEIDRAKEKIILATRENQSALFLKLRLINEGYSIESHDEQNKLISSLKANEPAILIIETSLLNKEIIEIINKNSMPFFLLRKSTDEFIEKVNGLVDFIEYPIKMENDFRQIEAKLDKLSGRSKKITEEATFFEKTGDFYRAADLYREIGDLFSAGRMYEDARDYLMAGEMYSAAGDINRAAQSYERGGKFDIAAKYYGNAGNLLKQNELLFKLERFYEAGKSFFEKEKLDRAILMFQKVPSSSPDYKKSAHYLGRIFFQKEMYKMAIPAFMRAIDSEDVSSKNLRSFYFLGLSYEKNGELEEAFKTYEGILGEKYDYEDVLLRFENIKNKIEEEKETLEKQRDVHRFNVKDEKDGKKRYERLSEIGKGGMGIVYKARDTVLDRIVALKVLSATFRNDKKVIETFIREAKSAAALNHLNIVTVHDAGIEDDAFYIAMEYIDGNTIREILKHRRFSIPTVIGILKQVARGLSYAHSQNIIHRDLSTNNIMLSKARIVKIMDFGLARVIKNLMSEQSIIGGTPSFMSPEQVEGDPVDHRTDIYTLGISLFEMSTGGVPFKKGDLGYQHLHKPPPNPRDINPAIPVNLEKIILKCLEKKPEKRYQSVEEILKDLDNAT